LFLLVINCECFLRMELHHWPSKKQWGLPSFDIDSLHLLAHIKFSGVPVTFVPAQKSWLQKKSHHLPSLRTSTDEFLNSKQKMIEYLRLKYIEPDTWLSKDQKLHILPLKALIEDKLLPCIHANIWLDSNNFTELTRGVYAKSCQYPLNFTFPNKLHQAISDFVKSKQLATDDEMMKIVEKLNPDGAEALNLFSDFLGEKDYLLGHKPSSVDALLFAVLAPLFKMPLQGSRLQNHLKGCHNLTRYINRILSTYFKDENEKKDDTSEEKAGDNDFTRYDWMLPCSVGLIAMLSYAANAGLLQTVWS